jgi:uncharacterized protein (TIGR02145 family)
LLNSFSPFYAFGQVPEGIPYQAVARDAAGIPLSNHIVNVRFSILDSAATGSSVYTETHTTNTNNLGSFTVNLGKGTPVLNSFTSINWGLNSKFLKVEIDTSSGSNYIEVGTQQMMSVPYALYAFNASFSANGVPVGKHGETCLSCWGKSVWSANGKCPQRSSISGIPDVFSSILNYGQITDYENNIYETIKIGNQTWMAENLRTTHFSNGDSINYYPVLFYSSTLPNWTGFSVNELIDSLWTKYGFNNWGEQPGSGLADTNQNNILGTYPKYNVNLYNWFSVNDSRKLCPLNWHVSTKSDWDTLLNFIGGNPEVHLKPIGYTHWSNLQNYFPPITPPDNLVGFGAIPNDDINNYPSRSVSTPYGASWWTSTISDGFPICYVLKETENFFQSGFKYEYRPVRCVKD